MTAKKELRGAKNGPPSTQPLSRCTIAYKVLEHVHEQGMQRPADLFQFMPKGRRNTVSVHVYLERLLALGYITVSRLDEIAITAAGNAFFDRNPEPSAKYVGEPAGPRNFDVWRPLSAKNIPSAKGTR